MLEIYIVLNLITIFLLLLIKIGNEKSKRNIVILIGIILCFVSGFRYINTYASDEWNYRQMYIMYGNMSVSEAINNTSEIGFAILNVILNKITSDPQILIFVASIFIVYSMMKFVYKYSKPLSIGIILLITTGMVFTSWNIMRQYIGLAIILFGIEHLFNKNFKKYLIYIILAASFHYSFWLMIPIYFLITNKKFFKKLPIILLLVIICTVLFEDIMLKLLSSESQYFNYVESIQTGLYGVGIIRVLVNILPTMVAIILRKKLIENNKNNEILINLAIISSSIMIISTQFVFFARINTLVDIYSIILIPQIINVFENRNTQKLVYMTVLVLYFIYQLYNCLISSSQFAFCF